jgi:acyl carrier protein
MDNLKTDSENTTATAEGAAKGGPVFPDLKAIIVEIIGADAAEFIEITEESAFVGDLEMDSIQIIQFAEIVNEHYGNEVDFVGWLSKKPIQWLVDLTIGDVATFIESSREAKQPEQQDQPLGAEQI